jgi:hypothetical protein
VDVVGLATAAAGGGDDEWTALEVAIRDALAGDPSAHWKRFAAHVQAVLGDQAVAEDTTIVTAVLRVLAREPAWLDAEPRFVDLASRVRAYPRIGDAARGLLAAMPIARAVAAIERYPRRAPRVTRGPLPERRDYLVRYRGGERAVWSELIAHAAAISLHAELRAEACAVAAELFARAALHAPCEPASEARAAAIDRLAMTVGPLPIALAACLHAGGPGLPPAAELVRVLDDHDRRVGHSHREIVGPLHVRCGRGTVELPALALACAVDPVVHGTGARVVDHLRAHLNSDAF